MGTSREEVVVSTPSLTELELRHIYLRVPTLTGW